MTLWQSALPALPLTRDEVHIWRASLEPTSPAQLEQLSRLLSPDERERARRFHFQRHREPFIVARATLRLLLGRYLGLATYYAGDFTYSRFGRPSLGTHDLDFNLSHAGDLALYAFAWQRAVGIDIELVRADIEAEQIATRFFSPNERAELHRLPAAQRVEAFFLAWTRKEAYIKARGEGLSLALDAFDVSLTPGAPAVLLATRDDPAQRHRWTLHHLRPGPGYSGALAVEGQGWRASCWQWTPTFAA
jgi:4'-phosphopantetheinyl transferase